jgi:hypothetical protein
MLVVFSSMAQTRTRRLGFYEEKKFQKKRVGDSGGWATDKAIDNLPTNDASGGIADQ